MQITSIPEGTLWAVFVTSAVLGRGDDRLLEHGSKEGVDALAAHALLDDLAVRTE